MTVPLYDIINVKSAVPDGSVILDVKRLSVPDGSLTAIVGQNGAGKSTLLKLMAFLETPAEGEIRFRGEKFSGKDIQSPRKKVTLVNQHPLLFKGNVFKNVAYGLKVRNVPQNQWERRVADALDMVDMLKFADRGVYGLSGGEIQRVAIARALAFGPEVIILDEPTAAVDALRVEMVESVIREVNRKTGACIVFSTHNFAQAHGLTDNVVKLAGGKIIQENIENLFSGCVETSNGQRFVSTRSGLKMVVGAACEGAILFSIPASKIDLLPVEESHRAPNRYEGVVTRMELRGEKIRIRLEGELNLRVELSPAEVGDKNIKLGNRMAAVFSPDAVCSIE